MGNSDVAQLPMKALDLERGWMAYPRPKTGIDRRCPLWPGTVDALREWFERRPTPRNETYTDRVFLTLKGGSWATADFLLSKETRKLLDSLGIDGNRNFYAIRHTFETIAGDSRDQVAVNAIMGHGDGSMASVYRKRISDERLVAVVEHVRRWLYAEEKPRLKLAEEDVA